MSILKERICDVFEGEENDKTFEEHVRELEDVCGLGREDLNKLTNDKILDYIDYLNVIGLTIV